MNTAKLIYAIVLVAYSILILGEIISIYIQLNRGNATTEIDHKLLQQINDNLIDVIGPALEWDIKPGHFKDEQSSVDTFKQNLSASGSTVLLSSLYKKSI